MKCVYDKDTNAVYISAESLAAFVFRGGDIDPRAFNGNKNGGSIVSHKIHTKKPNLSDAYSFTTISDGINITVYTYYENVRKDENGYTIENVYSVPYRLDDIENGELEIATKTAMLSAYIVLERYKQLSVKANITFFREGGDEERAFTKNLVREELTPEFEKVISILSYL